MLSVVNVGFWDHHIVVSRWQSHGEDLVLGHQFDLHAHFYEFGTLHQVARRKGVLPQSLWLRGERIHDIQACACLQWHNICKITHGDCIIGNLSMWCGRCWAWALGLQLHHAFQEFMAHTFLQAKSGSYAHIIGVAIINDMRTPMSMGRVLRHSANFLFQGSKRLRNGLWQLLACKEHGTKRFMLWILGSYLKGRI